MKRNSRASVASFDSFRDEVKRPERVLSFKRPWESDRELGGMGGGGYDSGPGRKPTLTSRYSS